MVSRPANRGDIKKIKEQIMELFRDVYRQSWNLPYKREVLAHTSNLMNFGASDLAIDEYIQESKHGPLISKCARIAFGNTNDSCMMQIVQEELQKH